MKSSKSRKSNFLCSDTTLQQHKGVSGIFYWLHNRKVFCQTKRDPFLCYVEKQNARRVDSHFQLSLVKNAGSIALPLLCYSMLLILLALKCHPKNNDISLAPKVDTHLFP